MNDDSSYYRNDRRGMGGGDTFFAFMTGLVLGSVAALMTSPRNRDKVKKTIDDVKQKGNQLLSDTTRKAEEATKDLSENTKEFADRAHDKVQQLADTAEQKAQEARRATGQNHRSGRGPGSV